MKIFDLTPVEAARQEYACRYAQEQFVAEKTQHVHEGRRQWYQLGLLIPGVQEYFAGILGFDFDGWGKMMDQICDTADWLHAEAHWHRLHAEGILRSHGEPVTL